MHCHACHGCILVLIKLPPRVEEPPPHYTPSTPTIAGSNNAPRGYSIFHQYVITHRARPAPSRADLSYEQKRYLPSWFLVLCVCRFRHLVPTKCLSIIVVFSVFKCESNSLRVVNPIPTKCSSTVVHFSVFQRELNPHLHEYQASSSSTYAFPDIHHSRIYTDRDFWGAS
jgi:hypothetical protein